MAKIGWDVGPLKGHCCPWKVSLSTKAAERQGLVCEVWLLSNDIGETGLALASVLHCDALALPPLLPSNLWGFT